MAEDISIRRGETFELSIEADDETAVSVRLVAVNSDSVVYIDETAEFNSSGEATIQTDDTFIPLGNYEYTLTITYSDGVVDILPDPDMCDDDCDLPKIKVCKSNAEYVS